MSTAARYGQLGFVTMLHRTAGVPVDFEARNGDTALLCACECGQTEVVGALIELKANPDPNLNPRP